MTLSYLVMSLITYVIANQHVIALARQIKITSQPSSNLVSVTHASHSSSLRVPTICIYKMITRTPPSPNKTYQSLPHPFISDQGTTEVQGRSRGKRTFIVQQLGCPASSTTLRRSAYTKVCVEVGLCSDGCVGTFQQSMESSKWIWEFKNLESLPTSFICEMNEVITHLSSYDYSKIEQRKTNCRPARDFNTQILIAFHMCYIDDIKKNINTDAVGCI